MKNHFAQAPGLICWVMVHFNHFHINSILILALAALFYAPSTLQPAQAADVQVAPPILDYTYPFNDPRLSQQLAAKRQVAELFTSLDCLFCPRAERLVSDLAQKTAVLTLVYHTDPEGDDYPLAREFSLRRQQSYSERLADGLLYTPELVINGHIDAAGHDFDDVKLGLTRGFKDDVKGIPLRPNPDQGLYAADLPAIALANGLGADIYVAITRPPYTVPKTMRQSITHPDPLYYVVGEFRSLGGYNGTAKTITFPFVQSPESAGFVIFIQRTDGIIIAAEASKG